MHIWEECGIDGTMGSIKAHDQTISAPEQVFCGARENIFGLSGICASQLRD